MKPADSLGNLATNFVRLLKSSPDFTVDLNEAASVLRVKKRRIYDVTNVLQGVDLISKHSKNNVTWNTAKDSDSSVQVDHAPDLMNRLAQLEDEDLRLGREILEATESLNSRLRKDECYLTVGDLTRIESMKGRNIFLIRGPKSTEIQPVPLGGHFSYINRDRALVVAAGGRLEVSLFNPSCYIRSKSSSTDIEESSGSK